MDTPQTESKLQVSMSEQPHLEISDVLARVPRGEQANGTRALIERAYRMARQAHTGQLRKSGEPYIQHPLAVAYLLADMGMDGDSIAAGLLHDVVEDSTIDLEQVKQEFGPEVALLVDGVTKLEQIDQFSQKSEAQRNEQESESLRKMFIAMAQDIRVVLIKLADRLHNMRTLSSLPPERRHEFALETMDIFAPLANRLGVWQWKWELEDLSLRYLNQSVYNEIAAQIQERRIKRQESIQRHMEILRQRLAEAGIEAEIKGRPKHIYSIYRKMERKDVPFSQIYDVRGIRVNTQTVPDCYRVLGIVHGLWKPIPGEFDDYIATPKDNQYQSLHTAVIGEDGRTLEIQIRTWEMHQIAEYGVAAHWRYKEGGKQDEAFEAKIAWLRSLMEWRKEVTDASAFVDAMKTDVFQDRVYTFTPKGKIIDLPVGATPIDFAYHIHTEIGHHCRGARVNGKLVSLDYRLKSGDQVEILTSRRGGPSRDWLNPTLGYVKTSRARTKIRHWFRRQDREQNVSQGREIVERELKRLGLDISHETVAKYFDHHKAEELYAAVGFGDLNSHQIASKIAEKQARKAQEEEHTRPHIPPPPPKEQTVEGIRVQGTGGLLTRVAGCCHPLPGQAIVGYVTRGRGVTIHRRDCPNILRLEEEDHDRLIEVRWGNTAEHTVSVTVEIVAYDRTGLLHEISGIISDEKVNIISSTINVNRKKNVTTLYITLEIRDIAQLSRILTKINRLPNVIEAKRRTN